MPFPLPRDVHRCPYFPSAPRLLTRAERGAGGEAAAPGAAPADPRVGFQLRGPISAGAAPRLPGPAPAEEGERSPGAPRSLSLRGQTPQHEPGCGCFFVPDGPRSACRCARRNRRRSCRLTLSARPVPGARPVRPTGAVLTAVHAGLPSSQQPREAHDGQRGGGIAGSGRLCQGPGLKPLPR